MNFEKEIKKMKNRCILCEENDNDNALWIEKAKFWNIHVCWFQHTLGTIGIILKRHVEDFKDLSKEEINELGNLLKKHQKRLCKQFNPDWFNIQMNCNWHHHLHFLLFPRYKDSREFAGKTYEDKTFGEPITYIRKKEDENIREELTKKLS